MLTFNILKPRLTLKPTHDAIANFLPSLTPFLFLVPASKLGNQLEVLNRFAKMLGVSSDHVANFLADRLSFTSFASFFFVQSVVRGNLIHIVDPELLDHIFLDIVYSHLIINSSLNDKAAYSDSYFFNVLISFFICRPTSSIHQSALYGAYNLLDFKVFGPSVAFYYLEFRLDFLDNIF